MNYFIYITHYVILLIWKLAWDMPRNDSKGNEYHAMNNTIDKQLSSLKVKIYFFAMSKRTSKVVKVVAQSEVYAIHG